MPGFTFDRVFHVTRFTYGTDNLQFFIESLIYLTMVFGVFGFEFCAVAKVANFECWNISAVAISVSTIITIAIITYGGFAGTCAYWIPKMMINIAMFYGGLMMFGYVAGIFYTIGQGCLGKPSMILDAIIMILLLAAKIIGGANFIVLFSCIPGN